MDLTGVILLAVLVAIAVAATRYGVDSRLPPSGESPPQRRPPTLTGDLVALARRARQTFVATFHCH